MASYSSPQTSESAQVSTPPLGRKGTTALAKRGLGIFEPIFFGGDFTSTLAQKITQIARNMGTAEATKQRGDILTTPGMTVPAKAKLVGDLTGKAIGAAAGAPLTTYDTAKAFLDKLLGTISVGASKATGGQRVGVFS